MGRKTVEVPLPPGFQPPEAADEFSDAQLALIEIGQRQSGLKDPVDALNFAWAQIEIGERCQRRQLDEITAEVGRAKRQAEAEARAAGFGISPEELKALIDEGPDKYRAVMKIRAQAHGVDIPRAEKLLADHRRRTAEQNEAATDRWQLVLNFSSKPPRGDDWRRMDKFGPMVAAEVKGEKRMKNAFRKQKEAAKPPKPKKPSWRKNPKFKEAAVYFAATRRGIVPDKLEELNRATGREAELLNAEAELDKWDKKRQEEGLDYAGFPWPKDKK